MKSNQEWKQWGKVDPLYAVASWAGKDKAGPAPWTDEDFYALGRSDWEDFYRHWQDYGCDRTHCIEIGCGAGRLTRYMAAEFSAVTALDVSEEQIEYAKGRVTSSNVTFRVTDGTRFAGDVPLATAVFSAHVFQHFDTLPDARRVFDEVFKVLSPGGTLMIHMPIYVLPQTATTPLMRAMINVTKRIGHFRARLNRRRGKLIMRQLSYDRHWLVNALAHIGFERVEFKAFQVRSNGSWHDFVLAQKPALI